MKPIQLLARAAAITDYFSPQVIDEVNDVYVKIAKIKGDEIPWHTHLDEDELFYIIAGSLLFEVEGQDPFPMTQGDLFVVRHGLQHRISSTEECSILLIENKATAHLGNTPGPITKTLSQQLENYEP